MDATTKKTVENLKRKIKCTSPVITKAGKGNPLVFLISAMYDEDVFNLFEDNKMNDNFNFPSHVKEMRRIINLSEGRNHSLSLILPPPSCMTGQSP